MKAAAFALASNLTSLAFAAAAGVLAWHDKSGWGWCIVGAIVTHGSVRWKESDDEDHPSK